MREEQKIFFLSHTKSHERVTKSHRESQKKIRNQSNPTVNGAINNKNGADITSFSKIKRS